MCNLTKLHFNTKVPNMRDTLLSLSLSLLHLLYLDKSGRGPQLRPNWNIFATLDVICCNVKERCLNPTPSIMEYLSQGWHVEYLSSGMYITLNVTKLALPCKLISWRHATIFESGCTQQWHNDLKWFILGDWAPKISNMWLNMGECIQNNKNTFHEKAYMVTLWIG